jgi:catechol 2,3-dioxygenase-like lactoylglutathione lyase family enzyme
LRLVLHHVSIEVPTTEVDDAVRFFELAGFTRVREPEPLSGNVTWVERDGTQIHLIHTDGATVPALGHPAIVADEFDATVERIRGGGFEVEEANELWGERRAFALAPGGHRVELMAAPPPAST